MGPANPGFLQELTCHRALEPCISRAITGVPSKRSEFFPSLSLFQLPHWAPWLKYLVTCTAVVSPHPCSSPCSRFLSLPNTCLQTQRLWPCLQLQDSLPRPVLLGRKGHEILLSFLPESPDSPRFLFPSYVTSLHTAGINKGSSTHKL